MKNSKRELVKVVDRPFNTYKSEVFTNNEVGRRFERINHEEYEEDMRRKNKAYIKMRERRESEEKKHLIEKILKEYPDMDKSDLEKMNLGDLQDIIFWDDFDDLESLLG